MDFFDTAMFPLSPLAIYASLSQDMVVLIQWVKKTQPEIHDIKAAGVSGVLIL